MATLTNITGNVPAQDQSAVTRFLKGLDSTFKQALTLDASLYIKLTKDKAATQINNTNGEVITLEVSVPDNLIPKDDTVRTIILIHVHNGRAKEIGRLTVKKGQKKVKFTVKVSEFSTFTMAYQDQALSPEKAPTVRKVSRTSVTVNAMAGQEYSIDGGNTWVKPGDDAQMALWALLLAASIAGIVAILAKKRKKEQK